MTRYAFTVFLSLAFATFLTTGCEVTVDTTGIDELFCGESPFYCSDGSTCVPSSFRCDGMSDCGDGSDEFGCTAACSVTEFMCSNTSCVPLSYQCDGTPDCISGNDEDGCKPDCDPSVGFFCSDGTTIDCSWQCDGQDDCADGSEEFACN